jgi:hypothetical protein
MSTVRLEQRNTRDHPCPVCSGWATQPRGRGVRCWGYVLQDDQAVVCTQTPSPHELAGGYFHLLDRTCDCGHDHGQYRPHPSHVDHRDRRHRRDQPGGARAWDGDDVLRMTDYPMLDYTTGKIDAIHRRYDLVDRKDFQRLRHGIAGLHSTPEADLPLYRGYQVLNNLVAANNNVINTTLLVCEGEKATDAVVNHLGLAAVGICIGAPNVPHLAVLQPFAAMYSLVIWPDADDPGQQLADRLGRLLDGAHVPLRILTWPDAPPKGDAFDFVARGGTREQAEDLIARAHVWQPRREQETRRVIRRGLAKGVSDGAFDFEAPRVRLVRVG